MSLNLDNLTPQEAAFRDSLTAAGVPTTATGLRDAWQAQTASSGITITNTSPYSPFWALVTSLVTTPVLWLLAYLVRVLMPSCYVQTATGSALDLLAYTYGLTRKPAAKATGTITFSRASGAGVLPIPAGTTVRTVSIGGTVYRLLTTAAAQFGDGQTSVAVAVIAEAAGAGYNLGAGYYSILDSYLPGVAATNGSDWLATPGADQESDADLRLRIRNQFLASGRWHTDAVYRALIAEFAGIAVDRIFFDHDIPRGPGSADAYILYDAAVTPTAQLAAINDYIASQGHHGHGDDLLVLAVPDDPHTLTVTVWFAASVPEEDRSGHLDTVEDLVRCIFRENIDYLDHVTQVYPERRNSMARLKADLLEYLPGVLVSAAVDSADIVSGLTVPRLSGLTVLDGGATS